MSTPFKILISPFSRIESTISPVISSIYSPALRCFVGVIESSAAFCVLNAISIELLIVEMNPRSRDDSFLLTR